MTRMENMDATVTRPVMWSHSSSQLSPSRWSLRRERKYYVSLAGPYEMEGLYNSLHRTGQTLETDATLRLPKRPLGNSNPNPNVFENFGSTLRVAPTSSQELPKSKPKSQSTVSREPTRPITIKKPLSGFIIGFDSESEDELDFLSSSQADPEDYQPSKKASGSQPGKYTDGNGKHHDYDPKFPFRKSQVLSKLKFTKLPKLPIQQKPLPKSLPKPRNKIDPLSFEESRKLSTFPMPSSQSSKSVGTSQPKRPPSSPNPSSPKKFPMDAISGGKVEKKLLPKLRDKTNPLSFEESRKDSTFPMPSPQSSESVGTSQPKRPPSSPNPSSPKNFPMDTISPLRGKVEKKLLPKHRDKINPVSFEESRKLSSFPMPSPQSSKSVETSQPKRPPSSPNPSSPKNFPMDAISPLGGKVKKKLLPKPRDKVEPPSFKAPRKLKAFPMPSPQSSDKVGIRSTLPSKGKNKAQPFPIEGLSKHQKGMSEDRSDDEQQAKKKRRSSLSYVFYVHFQCRFRGSDLIGSDLVNVILKTKAIQVRTQATNHTRALYSFIVLFSNNLSRH